jgi:DNA ligase (NAD+)
MDEKALSEALEAAIALGMKGDEVDKAQEAQKRFEEEKELASGVKAAMKALTVKADSKSGVQKEDLKGLKKAIEDNGGKVGSSISAKTDFVIAGDNTGPAKLEKANQLKITIISELDFKSMVE